MQKLDRVAPLRSTVEDAEVPASSGLPLPLDREIVIEPFPAHSMTVGSNAKTPGGPIDRSTSRTPRTRPAWLVPALVVGVLGVNESAGAQVTSSDAGDVVCENGVISDIQLNRLSVFDPDETSVGAIAWTYRAMNLLHVRTAASFVRRELLFEEGDCFDQFLLDESALLLEAYDFIAYSTVEAEEDGEGGWIVHVETRDEWSTQVDVGLTFDESRLNLEKFEVTEENFLGQGIFAEVTHRERRESRTQSIGLATPRFFGRADASIRIGRDRPGNFFSEYIRYPFIGETGKHSFRHGYDRVTNFFSYTTDGQESFTQVLVPSFREVLEFSYARRFGERYKSFIAGVTFTRDVIRFPRIPNVIYATDFSDLQPYPGALPAPLQDHLQESGSSRLMLHIGTRRYRYRLYEGLDGLRNRQNIPTGLYAGVSVGRGFDLFVPGDVPALEDFFGRAHATFTLPVGSSILLAGSTLETRHDDGSWKDVLLDADFVAYLRNDGLPGQTFFFRTAFASGWNTERPYQVSLGGREGVRSLVEDRFPGGRMLRFVAEERILFPWPSRGTLDLGMTLFTDIGRVWEGDVPYGVDSGWQTALGIGLRIGLPPGTRHVWRTDLTFPVVNGSIGSPQFRVTFELNQLTDGFFTDDVFRSRRYNIGAEHF